MTNLEYYKKWLKDEIALCKNTNLRSDSSGVKQAFGNLYQKNHFKFSNSQEFVDWLLDESEKIKLTRFEYDLIQSSPSAFLFKDHNTLMYMQARGYFEDVKDTDMSLSEILNNCEVVDD